MPLWCWNWVISIDKSSSWLIFVLFYFVWTGPELVAILLPLFLKCWVYRLGYPASLLVFTLFPTLCYWAHLWSFHCSYFYPEISIQLLLAHSTLPENCFHFPQVCSHLNPKTLYDNSSKNFPDCWETSISFHCFLFIVSLNFWYFLKCMCIHIDKTHAYNIKTNRSFVLFLKAMG